MWKWLLEIFNKFPNNMEKKTFNVNEEREFMRRVINAFEMGKTTVDYDAIYIYKDGPGSRRQLTLSWGITEYSTMRDFIRKYIAAGGKFAQSFKNYVDLIGRAPLVDNENFRFLLKKAAREDPIYRDVMDKVYYEKYYEPAMAWAEKYGFKLPLSKLVILDSFVHSGSILMSLRNRFSESVPSAGGDEKAWVSGYLNARIQWLENHSRAILNKTSVRAKTFLREIGRNNWDLNKRPINCNGVQVN